MTPPSAPAVLDVREPASTHRSRGARLWRWGVGFTLLFGLLWIAGPARVLAVTRSASPVWAAAAAATLVPWFLLGALNVWLLLRQLTPVRFATFTRVYAASWAASLVTPGQLGDVAQVVLLSRESVPMAASTAAYVTDKVFSLGFFMVVAVTGLGLYVPRWQGRSLAVVAALSTALFGVLVAAVWTFMRNRPAAPAHASRLSRAAHRVYEQLAIFVRHPAVLSVNIGITVAKWLLVTLAYWGAFRAFGASVSVSATATIPVISSLVGYVPISVGGLGTSEWTAVALFGKLQVPEATVVAVYLFLRIVLVLLAAFILVLGGRRPPTTIQAAA